MPELPVPAEGQLFTAAYALMPWQMWQAIRVRMAIELDRNTLPAEVIGGCPAEVAAGFITVVLPYYEN